MDPPTVPFIEGLILPEIPQTPLDRDYEEQDLQRCLAEYIYEEVTNKNAYAQVKQGTMPSSAFTLLQPGSSGDMQVVFMINFSRQSKHWEKGSIKIERILLFAIELQQYDHLISFDIREDYRAF